MAESENPQDPTASDPEAFAAELAAAEQADEAKHHPASVEWNGENGLINTGPVGEGFDPTDFDAILRRHGLDPEKFYIVGSVGFTSWDQWLRTGVHHRMYAHRFRFLEKGFTVDLPALYAEIDKGPAPQVKHNKGGSTVVVCWADIQTGKVDYLGGLQEMLARLEEKRAALVEYLDGTAFDHIIVADVGDIIEGFDNVKAQIRTNSLSLMDQVDIAAVEFWKCIRACEAFAPVDVLSIPSNHGQWRKGKELLGLPTDDWGLHISKQLERRNEDARLDVTFHRPENDWDEALVFDVRGTRLGLAHGHQATNPDKVRDWWSKLAHAGVLDCHVLLTGHFHFPSLRPSGRDSITQRSKWHIQAGTLDNGSAWVRNKYGDDGDPCLTVFQINDDGFDPRSFALL